MRRRAGYALACVGAVLAVASYFLRYPAFITANGHGTDMFAASAVVGLLLITLGIVLLRRAT